MDVYSLLNINEEEFRNFPLLARNVVDHQVERVLNSNINKLRLIKDKQLADKGLEVPSWSVDKILQKVIRLAKKGDYSKVNWEIRELRIISYYLIRLRSYPEAYSYAIKLLDENWSDLFFNGLVFYLVSSWHSVELEYREMTSRLVISKLQQYTGKNKRYNLFKNHANLFESAGPARMAAIVSKRGLSLLDTPQIIGFRSSTIKQQYYSDVIIKYVRNNNIHDFDEIEELFEVHDLDRTKKLVLASLVENENTNPDIFNRAHLCRFINRILGDVTLSSTWAPFSGATDAEAQYLRHAMKLVNMWFAQKTIETFFEVCVQDKDRKDFWLQYVDRIDNFKIVGSQLVRITLQSNNKLGNMLFRQFIETNSQSSRTSALVLFIKNKMLIEFSDVGALYVYEHDNRMVDCVRRRNINSTNDLKDTSIGQLIESTSWGYYFYSYGRMTHRGQWQDRLSRWLEEKLFSGNVKKVNFFDNKDEDKIFKAVPLPKEPEIKFDNHVEEETDESDDVTVNDDNESSDVDRNEALVRSNVKLNQLRYILSSKIVDDTKIVADDKAFYVFNLKKHLFVPIKAMQKWEKPNGSIWLKKTRIDNWLEVVHNRADAESTVGYVNISDNVVKYKELMTLKETRKITF